MFRPFPLDDKLLLFDRETGANRLIEGGPAEGMRQVAPRVLQISLTNACNKQCSFCYRPLDAKSAWSFDEMLELAHVASEWGVLEFAFGGGEPTVFPRFAELVRTIWEQTEICPNFTTNGLRLSGEMLREMRGAYGQIQLSVYDEDDTDAIIARLVDEGARFGLNYLVTPERAKTLERDLLGFMAQGVRDVLLLSYKGRDRSMHLSPTAMARLDETLARIHPVLAPRMALKVDVCWGSRLTLTPRLFETGDCGAGRLFCSVSSDRRLLACSFGDEHATSGLPIERLEDLPRLWAQLRDEAPAADSPGCARLEGFGLSFVPTSQLIRPRARS